MPAASKRIPEQKRVSITSKRQLTIPQKYYTELGFGKEAICIKGDGYLVLRPSSPDYSGEFSVQILADLIADGLSGTELLDAFKVRQAEIRPAVKALLEEAHEAAQGKGSYYTYEDIFGSEE